MCVLISSSLKDTSQIRLRLTLMISFFLNYLFKDPIWKFSPVLNVWDVMLSTYEFYRDTIQPITLYKCCMTVIFMISCVITTPAG